MSRGGSCDTRLSEQVLAPASQLLLLPFSFCLLPSAFWFPPFASAARACRFRSGQPILREIRGDAAMRSIVIAVVLGLSAAAGSSARAYRAQTPDRVARTEWVAESLQRMESIRPGMKRSDLTRVFTTEGGLFTRTRRTYVSLDCPYFKVDVQFRAAGTAGPAESNDDVIAQISRPYLQHPIMD